MLRTHLENIESSVQIGVDEAGRGPLVGRVYAAAVVLPDTIPDNFREIKDSKKFSSAKKLGSVAQIIMDQAKCFAIGYSTCDEIDKYNIRIATHNAMHRAIRSIFDKLNSDELTNSAESTNANRHIVVDGSDFKPFCTFNGTEIHETPFTCIPQGDSKYMSIAAASILAKYERDKYIDVLVKEHPDLDVKYCLSRNKGYGTKAHIAGIKEHGITKWHRRTFGICKEYSS